MDIQPVPNTYILLKRFQFPTGNTTRDAIAVSTSSGLILNSLYTLMVKVAIGQIWAVVVFLGTAYFIQKTHTYNRAAATAGVYNASASQTSVIKLLISYLKPMKKEIWYPIMWAVLAALAIAGTAAASTLIPRLLVLGHAAPVNPSTVYYPGTILNNEALTDNTTLARAFALTVPMFLRAAGQVEVTPQNSIMVEQENSTDPNFVRINYSYNITAAEFGLQYAPNLIFYATGSCYTEKSWLVSSTETDGTTTDTYARWNNNATKYLVESSGSNGGPPFAYFMGLQDSGSTDTNAANVSYSIVVSSVDRPSYTASTDPWYLTVPSNTTDEYHFNFTVKAGRPALSCWETNVFTYKNKSADESNLNPLNISSFTASDINTPPFLVDIIQYMMSYPVIVQVGATLGRSNLKSATSSALGHAFNAGTSSILQDLRFLIMASYIATKNMYVETTRFPLNGRDGIPDVARSNLSALTADNSGPPRPGTGDFVITDPGVTTLSVQVLISIPVAMAAAVGAVFLLKYLPGPWQVSHALNATVLYSHLSHQEDLADGVDADWNRESAVATFQKHELASVKPVYHDSKKKKGFRWRKMEEE